MSTPSNPNALREAHRRLAAQRARISRIRRRVIAGSLASFVIAFATIAGTGSLGTTGSATASSSTTANVQSSSGSPTSSSGSSSAYSDDQSASTQSSQDTVSPVTTSQS